MQDRKRRIIHEAFQLFCREGIDKVSLKEIANKSKVAEKSIYRYFGTKVNLVIETGSMLWKEIVSGLLDSIGDDYAAKSGYEQVVELLQQFRVLFGEYAQFVLFSYDYKLFLIRHGVKITADEYSAEIQPLREQYLKAFQKGMRDGSIKAEASPEELYFAIWGLMRGYSVKIVIYDRMYAGENIWRPQFDMACGLILSGLRNGVITSTLSMQHVGASCR